MRKCEQALVRLTVGRRQLSLCRRVRLRVSESDVPNIVIRRLPLYARELGLLEAAGRAYVSSKELGSRLDMAPAQIRKDLSYFGRFGKQGLGYDVRDLQAQLRGILGLNGRVHRMVLVGVGQLGRAVLDYSGFREQGFHVVRAFDSDPEVVGGVIADVQIADIAELPDYLAASPVQLAIVAVPADAARSVVETLVKGCVNAILSYAPIATAVPEGVQLRQIDPVMELQSMAYYLAQDERADD